MRPEANGSDDEKRAAGGGAARFVRQNLLKLFVAGVLVALGWAALRGSDGPGGPSEEGSGGSSGPAVSREPSDDPAVEVPEEEAAPPGGDEPTDVEEGLPPVDLGAPPGGESTEVARWWAATYARYAGADPPRALAGRLAPATARELHDRIAGEPPAASYDEPVEIVGASATALADTRVQVAVETPGSLLLYEVTLVWDGSGRWVVTEVERV